MNVHSLSNRSPQFSDRSRRNDSKPTASRPFLRSPIYARPCLMMRNLRGHISVRRWRINRQSIGLLNKLPDGNNRAQTEKRVNDSFHDATALLFRADQQRVCRFIFVVHDNMRPSFFMMKTPPTSHFV